MENEKWLTPAQIAKALQRSVQWVYDAIECGELNAENLSLGAKKARWVISASSLRKFRENRGIDK